MTNSGTGPQPQQPQHGAPIDAKDRHGILTQQIIDDLARTSRGRQHQQVVGELTARIAEQNLPEMPQPWLEAVAAAAIMGNAYVVTATTGRVSDVPEPSTDRPGETLK